MKTVFFGAGGLGSFYGAMLQRGGAEVWFVDRDAQLKALRGNGLRVESPYGNFVLEKVNATDDTTEIGAADLVVACVKQYQTAGILDALEPLVGENTSLMLFQNGVEGHAHLVERFGAKRVVGGVPIISSNLVEPGFVRHVASGEIVVGELDGATTERVEQIAGFFQKSGVPATVSANVQEILWHKLLWNVGFTGLICLTGCDSQELLHEAETRRLIESAITEAINVGRAQNYNFAPNHLEMLIDGTAAQPPIRTSMLLDREAGRPLEYDAITGVVVRRGRKLNVPTPTNELIYAALKVVDAHNRKAAAQ